MVKNHKVFKNLEIFYLFMSFAAVFIIAPTHIFSQPYFMYARFPHYLEKMPSFFGLTWPLTFDIYHLFLAIIGFIVSINILSIIFYPKLKTLGLISSLIGAFLFSAISIFFFTKFVNVNTSTAVVFGLYFIFLWILDLLTIKALIAKKR